MEIQCLIQILKLFLSQCLFLDILIVFFYLVSEKQSKTIPESTKTLSSGQISAAAVEQAIAKLTAAGGKYANGAVAQSDTLNGRLSTLQDSFQRLGQSIGANLEPVFKGLINLSIVIVEKFGGIITVLGSLTAAVYLFNAAMVKFAAINIATILATIGGGLTTVVTGYTAAGAAVTATNLTVSASTVAFGALKVAMLALPFVAVAAGVALVIAKFREADEESTKFFNAQPEKVLEEAEKKADLIDNGYGDKQGEKFFKHVHLFFFYLY